MISTILISFLVYMLVGFILNRAVLYVTVFPIMDRCETDEQIMDIIGTYFQPKKATITFKTSNNSLRIVINTLYSTLRWPENLIWAFESYRKASSYLKTIGL